MMNWEGPQEDATEPESLPCALCGDLTTYFDRNRDDYMCVKHLDEKHRLFGSTWDLAFGTPHVATDPGRWDGL